jgi:hypothetical protein
MNPGGPDANMHDAYAQFHLNPGAALPGEDLEEDYFGDVGGEEDDEDVDAFNHLLDSEVQLERVLEHSDDEASVESGPLEGPHFWSSYSACFAQQDLLTAAH